MVLDWQNSFKSWLGQCFLGKGGGSSFLLRLSRRVLVLRVAFGQPSIRVWGRMADALLPCGLPTPVKNLQFSVAADAGQIQTND